VTNKIEIVVAQTMIDLQSQTAKRDQSYDMISNILKSLHTTLMTNVNNM
jgi:hypothetical protein